MKRLLFIVLFICSYSIGMSQEKQEIKQSDYVNTDVEMADQFRADGKIYVLTGIILVILFGTVFYLVTIDRKVTKLEKDLQNTEE